MKIALVGKPIYFAFKALEIKKSSAKIAADQEEEQLSKVVKKKKFEKEKEDINSVMKMIVRFFTRSYDSAIKVLVDKNHRNRE